MEHRSALVDSPGCREHFLYVLACLRRISLCGRHGRRWWPAPADTPHERLPKPKPFPLPQARAQPPLQSAKHDSLRQNFPGLDMIILIMSSVLHMQFGAPKQTLFVNMRRRCLYLRRKNTFKRMHVDTDCTRAYAVNQPRRYCT